MLLRTIAVVEEVVLALTVQEIVGVAVALGAEDRR